MDRKFSDFLTQYGFSQCVADPCVFFLNEEVDYTVMAIWVDDGIICSSNPDKLQNIINYLNKQFEMTSGSVQCFVGIQIKRDRKNKVIHLSQGPYIERVLNKFKMSTCHPRGVPADPHSRLSKALDLSEQEFPYREAIGSLIFAASCTRPDIAYAVNQASQHCSNPSRSHWEAVKRILSYLRGSTNFGIGFGSTHQQLVVYSDSDYAGDLDDRSSTTGAICFLNGGPVSWTSQKQKGVSQSSTEVEYVATSVAANHATWLRELLREIGCGDPSPTPLLCDNQGAIRLIHNPEQHSRTKHIDVRYHLIRKLQDNAVIKTEYINTRQQLADFLTKPLDGPLFLRLRSEAGIYDFDNDCK
jgi:hypothetical protein